MVAGGIQERRADQAGEIARALLNMPAPMTFEELVATAPSVGIRELADWLGHAVADGLVAEHDPGPDGRRRFTLRARGRRILSAQRRAAD